MNSECCRANFDICVLVRSSVAILGALSNGMTEEEAGQKQFLLETFDNLFSEVCDCSRCLCHCTHCTCVNYIKNTQVTGTSPEKNTIKDSHRSGEMEIFTIWKHQKLRQVARGGYAMAWAQDRHGRPDLSRALVSHFIARNSDFFPLTVLLVSRRYIIPSYYVYVFNSSYESPISKKIPTDPRNIPQVPQNTKCDFLHKQVVEGLGYVPRAFRSCLRQSWSKWR